jgi:hypothetical protein
MTEGDPITTVRELRDYVAVTYEANHKIAARIGVTTKTFTNWLTGRQPMGKALEKLRVFLDAEAKRNDTGDDIRPIERVPLKIVLPPRQLHYARLCPFCRKARGKIRKLRATLFQGVCPKCGATGPKRESHRKRSGRGTGRKSAAKYMIAAPITLHSPAARKISLITFGLKTLPMLTCSSSSPFGEKETWRPE